MPAPKPQNHKEQGQTKQKYTSDWDRNSLSFHDTFFQTNNYHQELAMSENVLEKKKLIDTYRLLIANWKSKNPINMTRMPRFRPMPKLQWGKLSSQMMWTKCDALGTRNSCSIPAKILFYTFICSFIHSFTCVRAHTCAHCSSAQQDIREPFAGISFPTMLLATRSSPEPCLLFKSKLKEAANPNWWALNRTTGLYA